MRLLRKREAPKASARDDRRRYPPFAVAVTALAAVAYVAAAALIPADGPGAAGGVRDKRIFVFMLTGLSIVNLLAMVFVRARWIFRVLLAWHTLLYLAVQSYVPHHIGTELLYVCLTMLPIAMYEAFPANLGLCLGVLLLGTIARSGMFELTAEGSAAGTGEDNLVFVALGGFFALFFSLTTWYREALIALQAHARRLDGAVARLTRANMSYQQIAQEAGRRSALQERQRLTRDIHDIVGYTLTNSVMMMEAAKVMAHTEPEKLPELIDQARSNTEGGLQRIREVLRNLRESQDREISGFNAVVKLVRVFQQATAVAVEVEFANTVWDFDHERGSALYHFVQEGLINAFRHGQATEITVLFHDSPASIRVTVLDNGHGAASISEGIGIQGMRERARRFGGEVRIGRMEEGFSISMEIPRTSDGEETDEDTAG